MHSLQIYIAVISFFLLLLTPKGRHVQKKSMKVETQNPLFLTGALNIYQELLYVTGQDLFNIFFLCCEFLILRYIFLFSY